MNTLKTPSASISSVLPRGAIKSIGAIEVVIGLVAGALAIISSSDLQAAFALASLFSLTSATYFLGPGLRNSGRPAVWVIALAYLWEIIGLCLIATLSAIMIVNVFFAAYVTVELVAMRWSTSMHRDDEKDASEAYYSPVGAFLASFAVALAWFGLFGSAAMVGLNQIVVIAFGLITGILMLKIIMRIIPAFVTSEINSQRHD